MKYISRILFVLAVMLCGAGTAQAATDDLNIVTTGVTGATVTAYVSTSEPTASYSASGTAATTVQHGQYLVLKVTPTDGKWLYNEMLEVQVAGGPGGALVRTRGLVVAENPTALSTNPANLADGTGYYYYKIPAECTAANGYKNVVVTGSAVSKIDLSALSTTIDATGKIITASADGWTATINLDDVSWTYDASSHGPAISAFTLTNGTKTFASPEVQADKTKQVSISGEQTNAGNYNATLSAVTGGCFTSSKAVPYSITANASDAVVVTITGNNASVAYDGTSHSVTGYTVSISNSGSLTYTESDFSFSGTDAAARTDVGTTNMELAASQFTNTNPNFSNVTFNVTDGYQTITAKEVGLTWANSTPYTYDGSAKAPTVEVTAGDLVAGDACTVDVNITAKAGSGSSLTEGKAVNVGNYTATATGLSNPNYKLKDDALKASDFSIVASDAATAVVTANDRTYDGTTQDLVTIGAITGGATGTAADVVFYADGTSATPLSGTPQRKDAGTYTVFYEVTPDANHTASGRLSVTVNISKATLTVTAKDQEHVYSGSSQGESSSVYTSGFDTRVSVTGLQGSDALSSVTLNGSATGANVYADKIEPSNAEVGESTGNYTITYVKGKLTITAKEVGLTWTNGTPYTYDGSAKAPTVEVTAGDLVAGDACTVDVNITAKAGSGSSLTEGKAVNVGNYTATATGLSNPNYKLKDDALKASDFSIVASDAATAVVTANDRTYDGTTQDLVTIGAITYGATGTAADVVFYADATSTTALTSIPQGTNAGSYDVYYEVAPDANHTVPARAKVIVTISQAAVTIKAKDQTVDFGTNITQSTDQVTVAGLQGSDALNSITLTASTSAVTTDGSATITPSAAVIKNGTTDVTANYSFTYDTGKLIINAVDPVGPVVTSVIVTITGHNSTEVYDGKEHSVSGYEVEISDPLYKESDFIFSGTAAAARTDAGTTNMGLAASQFTNTNANFSVTFNVTDGFVTISQKGVNDNPDGTKGESQVTIVIDPTSFVYNGKDQKPTTITVKDGDSVIPVGEYTVSYQLGTTTVKETKEVGTYTVVITDNAGGNYTVSGRKDYTITQKPLTITAKAKTISYGSEGSNNGVTYSGFVEGENETTEGVFSGTLTYQYNRQEDGQGEAYTKDSPVGTYYIIPSGLTSKNYAITFKAGILTVSDKVIVIGDPDDASADATIILNQTEFIYNGKDQKPEVTITLKDGNKVIPASEYVVMHKNAEGKELKETKDAGTYTLEITSKEGADYAFSGKTTINYTIKPKTLTVTAIAQTKNVGEDDPEFTYTYDGFVEGDEDVFSGALARDEGEDVGEYAITQGTLSAGDNYTIAFTGAKLTIKDIKESFKVVVAESEGGSVSVSKIEASPGTQINMKITPVTGYHLETITIKKSHGGEVQHDITFDAKGESWDYFLMPSDDVIITAVFEKDKAAQNIFIYKSYYGEVVANTNSADENEQVNLVAHPAYDNCVLDELVVINDEGKQLDLTTSYDSKEGNIYTFMMTGNWVQVYSTFRGINDVVDGARPFGLDNRFYQLSQKDQSILQTTAETKDVQIGLSLNANIFCQVADDGSLMMEQGEDVGLMIGGLKKGNFFRIDHDGEIALKNPDIIKEINDAFPQPAHILTRGEDTAIIKPGVAYEVVEDGNLELVLKGSAPLVLKSIIVEGPDPTAINRLQADDEAADIYDLSGRKVDPTSLRMGMYIRNGKKIVIK